MTTLNKHIADLLLFYVKTHYEGFLKINKIDEIPEKDISRCVKDILDTKKTHSLEFLKYSLKEILKDEYPGDNQVDLITRDMYSDDKIMISKISDEIKNYQIQISLNKDKKD